MSTIDNKAGPKVRIISYSGEQFQDRNQAGSLLAEELKDLRGKKAVVLGIPRGGVIVARALAEEIGADLDIVLARKLGTPGHEELAMGALGEGGKVILNQDVMDELFIPERLIQAEKERQMAEIDRRSRLVRSVLPKARLQGRIVVITDDGVATGATMHAAILTVRQDNPQKLIAAVPVASEEAINRIAGDVDEVICLQMPAYFMAVGQFYRQFSQVTDEEVLEVLKQEKARIKSG